jgi:hypothetical protein
MTISFAKTIPPLESQTVLDTQHDHYQVMNIGWDGNRRVHGCVLQIDQEMVPAKKC